MKKVIRYLVFVVGGLIIIGVLLVVLNPGIRQLPSPSSLETVGKDLSSQVRSTLILGLSREGPGSGSTRTEFSLGEKIYATVVLKRLERGDHSITFLWVNPKGTVQERYRKDFFSPGGNYQCWS